MAKKIKVTTTCRTCKYSHSPYCLNYKGEPIMCKCTKSEFSKLLNQLSCKKYVSRK